VSDLQTTAITTKENYEANVIAPAHSHSEQSSGQPSSSSTRMVVGPGYDCEGANRGKAGWLPFASERIGRKNGNSHRHDDRS
jgi:hypothetical protein